MTDKKEAPCEDIVEGDEPDALEVLADYSVEETNAKEVPTA